MFNLLRQIHFIRHGWFFFLISIITITISTYYIKHQPLKYDIEFTGGTTIQTDKDFNTTEITKKYPEAQITQHQLFTNITIPNIKLELKSPKIQSIAYVGPSISKDLISTSIQAIIISLITMLIYISYRFEWYFGICTVLTLIHNLYITYGFICYQEIPTNLHVIAALLFIIGYSINDSIVIFDRIRENKQKYINNKNTSNNTSNNHSNNNVIQNTNNISINTLDHEEHSEVCHNSIIQTLYRTTYTVLTTLVAPIIITILGNNDPLEHIGIISTVGIIAGAYASIFLSAFTLNKLHQIKNIFI